MFLSKLPGNTPLLYWGMKTICVHSQAFKSVVFPPPESPTISTNSSFSIVSDTLFRVTVYIVPLLSVFICDVILTVFFYLIYILIQIPIFMNNYTKTVFNCLSPAVSLLPSDRPDRTGSRYPPWNEKPAGSSFPAFFLPAKGPGSGGFPPGPARS